MNNNKTFSSIRCLLIALLLGNTGNTAELYKIVDAEGNVTFSQFPPAEPQESAEVESVKVAGAGDGMTQINTRGTVEYCGEIELPSKYDYSNREEYYLRQIGYRSKSWQRRLERLEEQVVEATRRQNQYNSNPYYRNNSYSSQRNLNHFRQQEKNVSDMRDLRCALHWAEKQQNRVSDHRESHHAELKRLEEVQRNLHTQMRSACGDEPPLDPSDEGAKIRRQQWQACSARFHKDLREVDREIRKVARQVNAANP